MRYAQTFSAARQTKIDLKRGNIIFEVEDNKIEFILYKSMKYPSFGDSCTQVDVIKDSVESTHLIYI